MSKIKKTAVCIALCMVMVLGPSLTSFAASGSTYSYANLNLTWTTTSASTSATLRSGTTAHLVVGLEGYFYKNGIPTYHKGSKATNPTGLTISYSYPYKVVAETVTAWGIRSNSQSIDSSGYLYY